MRKSSAITFIELLVVIIIIGILAGVSIPQFRKTFDNFELENFVKDIYYLSRYLQSSAISQGKIYRLNIDKDKNPIEFNATYQIKTDQGETMYQAVEGRFGKSYQAPQEVTISTTPQDIKNIYFYPDGSVKTEGDIDNIAITLKNRYHKEISLSIQGAAGDIKIQ